MWLFFEICSSSFQNLGYLLHLQRARSRPFMTSTKNDQFLPTPPPSFPPTRPHHPLKWTMDLLFKNNKIYKRLTNFKIPPCPFCVDVINVWSPSKSVPGQCLQMAKSVISSCRRIGENILLQLLAKPSDNCSCSLFSEAATRGVP